MADEKWIPKQAASGKSSTVVETGTVHTDVYHALSRHEAEDVNEEK
jgi:hypothetical protein